MTCTFFGNRDIIGSEVETRLWEFLVDFVKNKNVDNFYTFPHSFEIKKINIGLKKINNLINFCKIRDMIVSKIKKNLKVPLFIVRI